MPDTYKIVRMHSSGRKRIIKTGLTLNEAQSHCRDPETSSSTARNATARKRTKLQGTWFDGYSKE